MNRMNDGDSFGANVQKQLYGNKIANLLKELPKHAGDFMAHSKGSLKAGNSESELV
ncbi:hypothetical protein [Pediococcus claussenii]|nr:hypothetical protein [Pediococcus claussenii]